VGRDESCSWVGSESLRSFTVPVFDVGVSPRSRVSGQVSVAAVLYLPKIAYRARSPAQVRGPCRHARILPRRDGIWLTKVRAQCVHFFHLVSSVCDHCRGGGAVAREELCASSRGVCQCLPGWLGSSM